MATPHAAAPRHPTEHPAHLWAIAARLQALLDSSDVAASVMSHRFIAASGRLSMISRALSAEAAAGDAGARRIQGPLQREMDVVGQLERTFQLEHAAIVRALMALIDLARAAPSMGRQAQADTPMPGVRPAASSLLHALIPVEEQAIELTDHVLAPIKRTARAIGNLGVRIALGGDLGGGGVAHLAQFSRRLKDLSALFHDLAAMLEAYQHGITGTLGSVRREIVEFGALDERVLD